MLENPINSCLRVQLVLDKHPIYSCMNAQLVHAWASDEFTPQVHHESHQSHTGHTWQGLASRDCRVISVGGGHELPCAGDSSLQSWYGVPKCQALRQTRSAPAQTAWEDAGGDVDRKMAEKTCMEEDAPCPRDACLNHCSLWTHQPRAGTLWLTVAMGDLCQHSDTGKPGGTGRDLVRHMKQWQTEETVVYTAPASCIAHWFTEMIEKNWV